MDDNSNPRAVMGGNNPPEPTPFELSEREISDLYDEAKNWLDGEPISTKGQADMVGLLVQKIRTAVKTADERRVAENKPFDEGKAAVQAKYAPLIADTKSVKGKAVLALEVCKQALAPWLEKEAEEKRAAAEAARLEAERKAQEAQESLAASRAEASNLETREEAERAIEQAQVADRIARRAENDTAKASGGAGRAISLRTVYRAEITDLKAAVWHFLAQCPEEVRPLIQRLADDAVRSAGKSAETMSIPGVTIHTERKVA